MEERFFFPSRKPRKSKSSDTMWWKRVDPFPCRYSQYTYSEEVMGMDFVFRVPMPATTFLYSRKTRTDDLDIHLGPTEWEVYWRLPRRREE